MRVKCKAKGWRVSSDGHEHGEKLTADLSDGGAVQARIWAEGESVEVLRRLLEQGGEVWLEVGPADADRCPCDACRAEEAARSPNAAL